MDENQARRSAERTLGISRAVLSWTGPRYSLYSLPPSRDQQDAAMAIVDRVAGTSEPTTFIECMDLLDNMEPVE